MLKLWTNDVGALVDEYGSFENSKERSTYSNLVVVTTQNSSSTL